MIKNKCIHFIPVIFLSCGEKREVQDDALESYLMITFMENESSKKIQFYKHSRLIRPV